MGLGRLEPVDLREEWQNEAGDFTPWLAREDNLALLSETLDLDLELIGQEQGVGPFRADIVCNDLKTDSLVLIENQLERTNHAHLGQLLTYAAGLDAVTIVWVAQRFTDEHQAALDWLNENTGDALRFFGLEIELWRIGDSDAAPKFNIVSEPNEWVKEQRKTATDSPVRATYGEYWTAFREVIEVTPGVRLCGVGQSQNTFITIGRSGVKIAAVINRKHDFIRAEVYLVGRRAKSRFDQLIRDKQAIEREFGGALDWQELPEKVASRVAVVRPDSDLEDRGDWPAQHHWLAETMLKLHRVFRDRVAALRDDGEAR